MCSPCSNSQGLLPQAGCCDDGQQWLQALLAGAPRAAAPEDDLIESWHGPLPELVLDHPAVAGGAAAAGGAGAAAAAGPAEVWVASFAAAAARVGRGRGLNVFPGRLAAPLLRVAGGGGAGSEQGGGEDEDEGERRHAIAPSGSGGWCGLAALHLFGLTFVEPSRDFLAAFSSLRELRIS